MTTINGTLATIEIDELVQPIEPEWEIELA